MRLSSIDRIAEEGIPAVQWAYDRLGEERLTQQEILEAMNEQLRAAGVPPISRSGFNRYVLRVRQDGQPRPVAIAPRSNDERTQRIVAALRKIEAGCADLRAAIEAQ